VSWTRRDVLRWSALGGAALALPSCGDNAEPRPPGTDHAAMVVEPTEDSLRLVVWSATARALVVEVSADSSDDEAFSTYVFVELFRAVVDITGLEPDTRYEIRVVSDDGVRMIHRARTAPRADAQRPVRVAVSADVDPAPEFASDLVSQLVAAAPELYVSLGDFPYTDNGPPAVDLDGYRARYTSMLVEPNVRLLVENVAVRGIYDDHEFRNDWDGMYTLTEPTRYAAAMQAWREFFPLARDEAYRSWRWGAHLELFMLDCRRYRDANIAPDGPGKTMLGDVQRAWLVDGVRRSTATFKVVLTSVPLDYGNGVDHWAGFAYEREAILDALAAVPGLLFVSADQHWFADQRHAHGIREFQVGPLARGVGTASVQSPNVLFRAARYNAALLDADATHLTVSALGTGGELFYKQTLSIADLTPAAAR